MWHLKYTALGFLVFLCACSGPGYFEPIQPAHDGEAVLYIYRPKADNPGMQPLRRSYPDILVDGKSVGVLSFNRHRAIRLAPGVHTLTATGLTKNSKWKPKDKEMTFKIEAGEIKYAKLDVRFDQKNMNLGQPGAKYLIFLSPMNPKSAIYEIRETQEE